MTVNPLEEPTGDGDDETVVDSEPTEPPTRPEPLCFVRGLAPRATVAWVRAHHAEAGFARVVDTLAPYVRDDLGGEELRPGLMEWVPFLSHCELLAHVDRTLGNGDGATLVDVGHMAAMRDLPAIVRPFARLVNPGFLVDMMTKIWRVYHTHGTWEVSRGQRDFQGALVGRPENHPAFCPVLRGYIAGAMKVAGALDVNVVEERCANKGAPFCSVRVSWVEKRDAVRARDRLPRAPL